MRIGGRILGGSLLACVLLAGACGGDDDGGAAPRATVPSTTTSSSTSTSSSTTTTEPAPTFEPLVADPSLTPEEQVEQAYLFYWEVVLDAFERGDPTGLPAVLTGEALAHRESELQSLVDAGRRFEGSVAHDYAITMHGSDEATVVDAERSRLATVDVTTGSTIEIDADEVVVWHYTMSREGDSWLVSYIVAYRPS